MYTHKFFRLAPLLATFGLLLFLGAKPIFAAPLAQEAHIYLPIVSSGGNASPTTPTPVTPTPTPVTPTPVTPTPVTPTPVTPTPVTPVPDVKPALFLERDWRTSSASFQRDEKGGMHTGYYFYEAKNNDAPTYAVYAYCNTGCDQIERWSKVKLAEDRDVIEVQLALTSAGHPRMLIRAASTLFAGGKDYLYASCDQNCTNAAGWQVGYVLTSDGTDIFDVYDDNSPQRSFALDPQDRPRFLYQDRNYAHSTPSHYGHFYVSCDSNCSTGTSEHPTWQQTRITDEYRDEFKYDYEILDFPSLTFTKGGAPRVLGNLSPLAQSVTPAGLYYFACDNGCEQRANWKRVYLLDRGSGADVSWDLTLDTQDRPRLALYRGTGTFEAEKVLYLWCNEQCTDQATKDDHWEFNDPSVEVTNGRHPDLKLDSQNHPRIAYVDQKAGGLGYAWCDVDCESDNAIWHHQVVENYEVLGQSWPVALPTSCDSGLWHGLTPVLSLDKNGMPSVAYDTTYHANCLYDDPSDGKPPYTGFHLIVRAVRVVVFEPQ